MDSIFRNATHLFLVATLVVFVSLLSGCGNKYGTTPVTGTVTLDGDPLAGAYVIFYPVEGGRANSTSKTNDKGEFDLSYTHDSGGAIPGSYKVLVSKTKKVNEKDFETLPSQYNSESTTVVEVTQSGENRFEFELNSSAQ